MTITITPEMYQAEYLAWCDERSMNPDSPSSEAAYEAWSSDWTMPVVDVC